jgi:RES domain-containing protein
MASIASFQWSRRWLAGATLKTLHNVKRLRTALKTAPSLRFERIVTRFVPERYRQLAGSPTGSLLKGGRYNDPGIAALYASLCRSVALREYTLSTPDDMPMGATSMLSLLVRLRRTLDLTDTSLLSAFGTNKEELTSTRVPGKPHPATLLGSTACREGYHGLIVWSALEKNEKNLVVFPENCGRPPYAIVKSVREMN